VHAIDAEKAMLRVKGDAGRLVWISRLYFSDEKQPRIIKVKIDDEITDSENDSIDVTIEFEDGSKRWTRFMTYEYLRGTIEEEGCFYDSKTVFVKSLNEKEVNKIVHELDLKNELIGVTLPY